MAIARKTCIPALCLTLLAGVVLVAAHKANEGVAAAASGDLDSLSLEELDSRLQVWISPRRLEDYTMDVCCYAGILIRRK